MFRISKIWQLQTWCTMHLQARCDVSADAFGEYVQSDEFDAADEHDAFRCGPVRCGGRGDGRAADDGNAHAAHGLACLLRPATVHAATARPHFAIRAVNLATSIILVTSTRKIIILVTSTRQQ